MHSWPTVSLKRMQRILFAPWEKARCLRQIDQLQTSCVPSQSPLSGLKIIIKYTELRKHMQKSQYKEAFWVSRYFLCFFFFFLILKQLPRLPYPSWNLLQKFCWHMFKMSLWPNAKNKRWSTKTSVENNKCRRVGNFCRFTQAKSWR